MVEYMALKNTSLIANCNLNKKNYSFVKYYLLLILYAKGEIEWHF